MKTPCKFCGEIKEGLLPHNRKVCDDPECRKAQKKHLRILERKRRRAERWKAAGPKRCEVCGKEIEIEQDVRRSYCLNPECEKQYKKDLYHYKLKRQREWYHGNKEVVEPVEVKMVKPIKPEDWFSQSDYDRIMREQRKLNGWRCIECGRALRGSDRFRCPRHQELISRIPDRVDGDYMMGVC